MTKLNYLMLHVLATIENLKHMETREEVEGVASCALMNIPVASALFRTPATPTDTPTT